MDQPKSNHQGRWLKTEKGEQIISDNNHLLGKFSNYFKIGHNAFEFLLDFGQFYEDGDQAQFHTRIVTSPPYARALLEILQEAILRYESVFGEIPEEEH